MMNTINELFANPGHLWWLCLIPILWLVFVLADKRMAERRRKLGEEALISKLIHKQLFPKRELIWLSAVIIFFVLALANPRSGTKKEKITAKAADIMIALDISRSMNTQDVSPSRMERSRRFLSEFIQSRKGDNIGLIFFAGEAYLQMPLSRDYAAADMFVRSASTSMAGSQGTAIGEAIDMAVERAKGKNPRALIIVTDGEDHDSDAVKSARKAAENGWAVFVVGVGTNQGGNVPESPDPGAPIKMKEDGSPVTSVLNESLIKDIASEGRGTYYLLSEGDDLVSTLGIQLEKIGKREMEVRSYTNFETYYQYVLFAGVFCLILSFVLPFLQQQQR